MRRCGMMVAVGLAMSGCKYLDRANRGDRMPPEDASTAVPTSGRRSREAAPTGTVPRPNPHWLDGNSSRHDLPPGRSNGRQRFEPHTDETLTGQGLLAGYVVDEYGKKIRGVLIDVTPLERSGEGAPTSIESDSDGSFHIHGLQPGLTYILSAQTLREGAKLAGQVYAKPPNARILLSLREGVALPAGDARQELPSPSGKKPRTPLPAPIPLADDSQRGDDSWAPTGPPSTNLPKSDTVPSSPRPELTTDGPPPGFRLPATNIAPPPINSVPSAPTIPPLPPTDFRQSQSIRPKNEFVLIDTMGRPKDFPHGREGELVLLEFLTTECVYCKKIIPYLKDLQSRYGARGLDVIGVLCDEIDTQQRRAIAASYQRSQDLNYQLYVEPGRRPGNVRDKFRVEAYPTMLLLSSDGTILWRGSPPHLASLEQAIEDHLGR